MRSLTPSSPAVAAAPQRASAGALRVAGALILTCALAAATVVVLGARGAVRETLGFRFTGVPDSSSQAASILVTNAELMATILLTVLLVQMPFWLPNLFGDASGMFRVFGDVLLGIGWLLNAALLGASIGAYGTRMLVAVLPHGPVEIAAFALASGLYLRARRDRLQLRPAARTLLVALALLLVAALLETYAA